MECNNCHKTTTYKRVYKSGNSKYVWHNKDNKIFCDNCYTRIYKAPKYRINKRKYSKEYIQKQKKIVIWHYSGGTMKCKCCGESHIEFLTIEHPNNDGAKHRKEIGRKIYGWLIKNNLPSGFDVLCFNCNCASYYFGKCPHNA